MVGRHAISHRLMPFVLTAIAALLAPAKPAGANVSFRLDVMPILSKAGCNAGKCHGNARGRGGFKLSLWGDRPGDDLKALTDNRQSSRVNLDRAAHSLVLRKPTRQVKHEGGVRFEVDSPEYRVLHDWIVAGAKPDPPNAATLTELETKTPATVLADPVDRLQLKVTATLSDGTRRDVSSLAVYEPSNLSAAVKAGGLVQRLTFGETTIRVRYLHLQRSVTLAFIPARPDFKWADPPVANDVDRHVFTKLKRLRINPSPLCDDRTFLRRAHLDITGRLPGAAESAAFLADTASGKRTRLIDNLLGRDAYADHWALKWADLLRVEEKVLDRRGVRVFHEWIRNSIAENKPLDQFARELLTAMGSTYKNPPANYYRALRTARHRAEATAQVFAGIRLGCARCHNHPYERWTQDDYYGFAAVFGGMDYKIVENKRKDKFDKNMFIGEQIVQKNAKAVVKNPRTGKPAAPRLLGFSGPSLDPSSEPREKLAAWLTAPDHPQFARVLANRIWYQMMGRGIVDPVDDFRQTNPPSNPALLDALARNLVKHGFDLRHLIRVIANSRTYQLSSRPDSTNAADATNFSRALVRRLTAEQMLDAFAQVLDVPVTFSGYDQPLRASQLPGITAVHRNPNPTPADGFLRQFGKPDRLLSCECERSSDTALGQVFQLVSGPLLTDLLTRTGGRLNALLDSGKSDRQIIDHLFQAALARPATEAELKLAGDLLARPKGRREALEDIAWSLLNSKEFLLRH